MFLIILSWFYIHFTTINLGFGMDKIINLKNKNFVITSILGLFSVTIFGSIWAVFGRINIEFHVVLFLVNVVLFIKYRNSISTLYNSFWDEIKALDWILKLYLILIFLLIVAQCASIPYINDNESYYIQTIKWINEYGFVKGIVNLHFFLGQTSGWHVTQSVFNFSFLYQNFNDLSGFCLFLGNLFAIQKLQEYPKNKIYLTIGLLPIANILFFQFISAPSPDIPVYVISFILFFYFLENYKNTSVEIFNLIVILVLFVLYIKNTTLTFVLIPLLLLGLNFKQLSRNLIKPTAIATLILILFITKNMIICGSPLFPAKVFNSITTNYAIPEVIERFYYSQLNYYGYFVTKEQYHSMSAFDLFLRWLTLPKMNGIFNKIGILLIVIVPFFIYKFQNKKRLWTLYGLMVVQMILLFITSPQYRFFLNFILFFSLFCLACCVSNKKIIHFILLSSLLPLLVILVIPINLHRFANTNFMNKTSTFSVDNCVFPHNNTKSDTGFETVQLGNLRYHSPIKNDFFWANGDGDLPAVNKDQIEYYKKKFHIIPQMRTKDLKDGFYAKKLSNDQ
jgi:hypothetical protein